jgi:hypothetical protein
MTRQNVRLDPKDVAEVDVVTFDFTLVLNTGETISSAVATSEVYAGTDALPAGFLLGAAQIQGLQVLQQIQAGTVGAEYLLRCTIVTSGGRTLVLSALIQVIRI